MADETDFSEGHYIQDVYDGKYDDVEDEVHNTMPSGAKLIQEDKRPLLGSVDVDKGEENIIGLIELAMGLEAYGDKILVLMDTYKSGYECGKCGGTGKVHRLVRCICDPIEPDPDNPVVPGTRNRHGAKCLECQGEFMAKRIDAIVECPKCGGKGATLFIPEKAKSLATTGIVLSKGPDVTKCRLNARIIATPHSGIYIPMKGNIPIKAFREHEPLCYLYNMKKDGSANKEDPGELNVSEFIEHDTPLGEELNA